LSFAKLKNQTTQSTLFSSSIQFFFVVLGRQCFFVCRCEEELVLWCVAGYGSILVSVEELVVVGLWLVGVHGGGLL
jgi:hypothetical protein